MSSQTTITSPHGFNLALDPCEPQVLHLHPPCSSNTALPCSKASRTEPRLRMVKDNTNRSPNYGELESERWGEERGSLGIERWEGVSECEGWGDER